MPVVCNPYMILRLELDQRPPHSHRASLEYKATAIGKCLSAGSCSVNGTWLRSTRVNGRNNGREECTWITIFTNLLHDYYNGFYEHSQSWRTCNLSFLKRIKRSASWKRENHKNQRWKTTSRSKWNRFTTQQPRQLCITLEIRAALCSKIDVLKTASRSAHHLYNDR